MSLTLRRRRYRRHEDELRCCPDSSSTVRQALGAWLFELFASRLVGRGWL